MDPERLFTGIFHKTCGAAPLATALCLAESPLIGGDGRNARCRELGGRKFPGVAALAKSMKGEKDRFCLTFGGPESQGGDGAI